MGHYYSEMECFDKERDLSQRYFILRDKIEELNVSSLTVGELQLCLKFLKKGSPYGVRDEPSSWKRIRDIISKNS